MKTNSEKNMYGRYNLLKFFKIIILKKFNCFYRSFEHPQTSANKLFALLRCFGSTFLKSSSKIVLNLLWSLQLSFGGIFRGLPEKQKKLSENSGSIWTLWKRSSQTSTRFCLWKSTKNFGTSFAQIFLSCKSLVIIVW